MDATHEAVFRTLSDLVELHSPSGVEGAVDDYLLRRLEDVAGATRDAAGNIVLRVEGREPGPVRAVLAHKDEIGALVKRGGDRGELAGGKLRGPVPRARGRGPGGGP